MKNFDFNEFDEVHGMKFAQFWQRTWGGPRAGRGDMSTIILHLLLEKRMHGYEIIRTLEDKSHGMWRPSAGSIYPTLQFLEEQELVESHDENGKKVYALTKKGHIEARTTESANPWENRNHAGSFVKENRQYIHQLIVSMKRLAIDGNEEAHQELSSILKEMLEKVQNLEIKHRHE